MTEKRLVEISALTKWQLYDAVRGWPFTSAMKFKREMQEALSYYAKTRKTMDFVQENFVERISWIEKWCRLAFMLRRVKALRRGESLRSLGWCKGTARVEWDELNKRMSY